jgi:hypothetical protein
MVPEPKREIIEILERSRSEFSDALQGISEEQASRRPEADRWSVLECVEHVVMVEWRLLGRLESAPVQQASAPDKPKEADLAARVMDRTVRVQAPEPVRPTGQFPTLAHALANFHQARNQTIQCATNRHADLYSLSLEHQRFGVLNGLEFLILMAHHARRHAAQIRETRAAIQ